MKTILTLLAAVYCLNALGNPPGDHIYFDDAKINGHPLHLAFDTGAGLFALFSPAAKLLGLHVTNPPVGYFKPNPGEVSYGWSETCSLTFSNVTYEASFPVINEPDYIFSADHLYGVIGWPQLCPYIFEINARTGTLQCFENLPDMTDGWSKIQTVTNHGMLYLTTLGGKKEKQLIAVDTGTSAGFELSSKEWQAWKAAHPNAPLTLLAYYNPTSGLVVREESLAKQAVIGPLVITNILIMEAGPADTALAPAGYAGTLGLNALKRLDFIVDGPHGIAYLRPTSQKTTFQYNRSGAIYTPRDAQSDDLIAQVEPASPAYLAGIHNGDVLLKIEDLDVTKWPTDPHVLPLTRFWELPAETKLNLTLRRGTNVFTTTVVLHDFLTSQ